MTLDADACYRALRARDARFDGLFFVAVATTGIYCRPVCPARPVKRENCSFYESAAAAEQAGYRPCLRCRPELAPGRSQIDAVQVWASHAARRIEQGVLNEMSVDELAQSLGVSGRQLRRALQNRFGVSPVELAQTQRLLTAKRLLADTSLSIGEVSEISGFSSLRRFNELFQQRYRMSPSALRRSGTRTTPGKPVKCELGYRPPYSWRGLLEFLAPRALPSVELIGENTYARTVRTKNCSGMISVRPHGDRDSLIVEVSESLAPCLPKVLERVRRLFDLAAEPEPITRALGTLAESEPGLRVPGAFDGFETAVRAVLGQQVTVKLATVLAGRFVQAFGEPVDTPLPGLDRTFPSAGSVASLTVDRLGELGIIRTRGTAILRLAEMVACGDLRLEPGHDWQQTGEQLRAIPGIGDWTADYIALRALSWPDAFPSGDLGVLKALTVSKPKEAETIAEAWRPWRAYAVMHLWRSL
jgi:AraC family transcriptional regulator of adaptative response / DNA-3-methyladenine glycosylase II